MTEGKVKYLQQYPKNDVVELILAVTKDMNKLSYWHSAIYNSSVMSLNHSVAATSISRVEAYEECKAILSSYASLLINRVE